VLHIAFGLQVKEEWIGFDLPIKFKKDSRRELGEDSMFSIDMPSLKT